MKHPESQKTTNRFLNSWFGIHGGREVFYKNQRHREFISNNEELEEYSNLCKIENIPCFVSVNPYRELNVIFGLEKLFFDFDSPKNLGKAWEEVTLFSNKLEKDYHVKPLIVFSGKKGYHVYVWLWNVVQIQSEQEEDFIKSLYTELQNTLLEGTKFKTLDHNPLGDIKRLARLPYSLHNSTRKKCLPINLYHEPIFISDFSVYRKYGLSQKLLESACEKIKLRAKIKSLHSKYPSRAYGDSRKVRPCLKIALNSDLRGATGHKMRLAIACEYLNCGNTIEDAAKLFQNQTDYGNGEKSKYFVKDAKIKGYKPFKCSTILNLGFCLHENCSIWKRHYKNSRRTF